MPTFLDAAGVPPPEILEGRSFLPVLTGATAQHKSAVFSLQTTRGIHGGSDYFPIRSVRDERYRDILNLSPEITFANVATSNRIFQTWRDPAAAGVERAQRLVHDYEHRPAEELYDSIADPWNQHNLIDDPAFSSLRTHLRAKLDAWMQTQGDAGLAPR